MTGRALTYWRRRRVGPLALSALSAVWVYGFVYLVGGGHTADQVAGHAAGFSGGRLAEVWLGLAVLVGSQVSDLIGIRRGSRVRPTPWGAEERP
ncbi:MAG: hypothetical protein ACRDUW_02260 [Pseudonocardiaceae bacterium]